MPLRVPYVRIFLSSPGDVAEERKIAMDVIENLPYRPMFRDRVAFRIIAWDKLGADTPMLGSLTPQEAIKRGLPRPGECDITIAIMWKRMGTPFIDEDGTHYKSGTQWEIMDALKNPDVETLIYRRTDTVMFAPEDYEQQEQYERVVSFFDSDVFYDKKGKIVRGYNAYTLPEDFRTRLQTHLEEVVMRLLDNITTLPDDDLQDIEHEGIVTAEAQDWIPGKSPFPGLRSFTPEDSGIFFGRGYETDKLVRHVAENRFVAVIGASGSGKSSLVGAGLIPRLQANAISDPDTGSKDWIMVRFTPGWSNNPFEALADALINRVPALACDDPILFPEQVEKLTESLEKSPDRLAKTITHALRSEKDWVELLVFIDQFEELFTLVDEHYIEPFATMIDNVVRQTRGARSNRVHIVATLRADFYHRAVQLPDLSDLLREGSFPVSAPRRDALRQMIERPAERAGVTWDEGLVERILADTGDGAGNLALMAYALDELYKISESRNNRHITYKDYEDLKGVRGAIGVRAENIFHSMKDVNEELLHRVFQRLVEVDEHGTATRRRARYIPEEVSPQARRLIDAFVNARLLVTDYDAEQKHKTVEVAHEAILREWKRLSEWIDNSQEDIFRLRQLRDSVKEWKHHNCTDAFLWSVEQVLLAIAALRRLSIQPDKDMQKFLITALTPETIPEFIHPPALEDVLPVLTDTSESPRQRHWAGIWVSHYGDPRPGTAFTADGIPDIEWCDVSAGQCRLPVIQETIQIQAFRIARYPITNCQFNAFIADKEVFHQEKWWEGLLDEHATSPYDVRDSWFTYSSHPRESVTWVQAMAYCRWLDAIYHQRGLLQDDEQLRLPTEWEWERAAIGDTGNQYPYGNTYDPLKANTLDSIGMTSIVGMYPNGTADCGAYDMCGNIWEWCLNKYFEPLDFAFDIQNQRVLRGGAWASPGDQTDVTMRWRISPDDWSYWAGFRVCISKRIDV